MPFQYQKHGLIKIGNICNSNCNGCSISAGDVPMFKIPPQKVKRELVELRRRGFTSVELIGGEVTIEPHFLPLLRFTSRMFEDVGVVTNGRLMSNYDYVETIFDACPQLDVEISIHGSTDKIHEAFTRTPRSFHEAVEGIKNVMRYKKEHPESRGYFMTNMIILNYNVKDLRNIMHLIRDLGATDEWCVLPYAPTDGRPTKFNKLLTPRYRDYVYFNEVMHEALADFKSIDLNEFPYCMVDKALIKSGKVHIINSDIIEYDEKNDVIANFNPTFSFNHFKYISNYSATPYMEEIKAVHDNMRTNDLPACQGCAYNDGRCKGPWKKYVQLFGEEEVNAELESFKKMYN